MTVTFCFLVIGASEGVSVVILADGVDAADFGGGRFKLNPGFFGGGKLGGTGAEMFAALDVGLLFHV